MLYSYQNSPSLCLWVDKKKYLNACIYALFVSCKPFCTSNFHNSITLSLHPLNNLHKNYIIWNFETKILFIFKKKIEFSTNLLGILVIIYKKTVQVYDHILGFLANKFLLIFVATKLLLHFVKTYWKHYFLVQSGIEKVNTKT